MQVGRSALRQGCETHRVLQKTFIRHNYCKHNNDHANSRSTEGRTPGRRKPQLSRTRHQLGSSSWMAPLFPVRPQSNNPVMHSVISVTKLRFLLNPEAKRCYPAAQAVAERRLDRAEPDVSGVFRTNGHRGAPEFEPRRPVRWPRSGLPRPGFPCCRVHSSALASKSMYSSETRPSPTGNKASHLTQPNLLC